MEPGALTTDEIRSQPEVWRRAAARAAELSSLLPPSGTRLAVVGCGTSYFIAQAFAAAREARGLGETDAFAASEMPESRTYDGILAISRSGTTTEVARLIRARSGRQPIVAVTAVRDTPVFEAADAVLLLDFADERSVVQTRFATGTLAMLRAALGEDLEPAVADAERALALTPPATGAGHSHFVFLGCGWTVGIANEAALKMREAAGAWAESYPAMEYRHGPISISGPASAVWAFGEVPGDVVRDVEATGATVVRNGLDPMAQLVLAQRTAVARATAAGRDADHPHQLTRSVVLEDGV